MPNPPEPLIDTERSKYRVGQVWTYQNRPDEDRSTVTVNKVELQHGTAVVVHVTVSKVKLLLPGKAAEENEISHMPFSEDALDASVTELVDMVVELPDFREGYEIWRTAFLKCEAGTFSVGVAQAVAFIEKAVSSNQ